MLHVGIDEAGYGPLLGPLVVAAATFRAPASGPGLRERLEGLACRAGDRQRARGRAAGEDLPVAIDDSKEVHRRDGVAGLARGVRACAVAGGRAPPDHLADLLERFGDRGPAHFEDDPWAAGADRARLPPSEPPAGLRERCLLRGVEPLGFLVSPMSAAELNEGVAATGNKARVLFLATATVLVRVLDAWPDEDVRVVLDREGGRLDYAAYLADVFPFHDVRRLAAPVGESRYRLRQGGREVSLAFRTRGDADDLAAGLASMAAKLTRELFMARLNAWFSERDPALRATAGYVEDGRRFLAAAAPVIERERLDLRRLVRCR